MKTIFKSIAVLLITIIITNQDVFGQCRGRTQNYFIRFCGFNDMDTSMIYENPTTFNVGIGTTVPTRSLDVVGDIQLRDTLVFFRSGIISWSKRDQPTGILKFEHYNSFPPGTTTIMQLQDNGNVGIGTTNPQATLHVNGDAIIEGEMEVNNKLTALDVDLSNIYFGSGGIITLGNERGPEGALDFQNTSSNIMRIENGGNIGIGTTSPEEKLHVAGNILTNGFIMPTNAANGRLLSCDENGVAGWIDQTEINDGDWETDGDNVYHLTGNVGIGYSTFSAKLAVNGHVGIGYSSPSSPLAVNGHVGIGTNAPSALLQIGEGTGDAGHSVDIFPSQAGNHTILALYKTDNEKDVNYSLIPAGTISSSNVSWSFGIKSTSNNCSLSAFNGSTQNEYLTIQNNGKVGINTSEPFERFQIGNDWTFHNGGIHFIGRNAAYIDSYDRRIAEGPASCIRFGASGDLSLWTAESDLAESTITWNHALNINSEGHVGIGTLNPLVNLHVNGKVIIGGNVETPSGYNLYVENGILAEKVKVKIVEDWSDYVFNENYPLKKLDQLEHYLTTNKHLPDIPTEEEVKKQGLDVAKMDALLLKKIEELTLYVIQQQKEITELKKKMATLNLK